MKKLPELRVFLSCPDDVNSDRDQLRSILEAWSNEVEDRYHVCLKIITGDSDVLRGPGRPQKNIDKLVVNSDIYIGMMWKKFGGPTGLVQSGTLEEYIVAFQQWEEHHSPEMLFFFKKVIVDNNENGEDTLSAQQIHEFKKTIKPYFFYYDYDSIKDLTEKVKQQFEKNFLENDILKRKIENQSQKSKQKSYNPTSRLKMPPMKAFPTKRKWFWINIPIIVISIVMLSTISNYVYKNLISPLHKGNYSPLKNTAMIDSIGLESTNSNFLRTNNSAKQEITHFRSNSLEMTEQEVTEILKKYNFYCKEYSWNKIFCNPHGHGFANNFELRVINGDSIVIDFSSRLMWQKGGSLEYMHFTDMELGLSKGYRNHYAGYTDWRLPTLEEAMSLVEQKKNVDGLFIDQAFNSIQTAIWTCDKVRFNETRIWVVLFDYGACNHYRLTDQERFIRLVRSF